LPGHIASLPRRKIAVRRLDGLQHHRHAQQLFNILFTQKQGILASNGEIQRSTTLCSQQPTNGAKHFHRRFYRQIDAQQGQTKKADRSLPFCRTSCSTLP
jgi:hypothetical protein